MTAAEWQARCDLAALYRIVDHLGWTDILNTHMSTRIPGEPGAFLINHYEEMFHEITASSLVTPPGRALVTAPLRSAVLMVVMPSAPVFHSPGDIASWVTNRSCRRPGPDSPTS